MSRYNYVPLNSSSNDIRLVTILPGRFDDPIGIKITHAPLVPLDRWGGLERVPLKEIRESLPDGWDAFESSEGRIIFWNYEEERSSWSHPDPVFPWETYNLEYTRSQIKYQALSYTWGSPDAAELAIVYDSNDVHDREAIIGYLPMTTNLAEAIRHLRYEEEDRIMWIDAICINQDDINERDEQVKRMGQIYSLAHRVVAWLGPSSPNKSDLAFSKLRYLGRQVTLTRNMQLFCTPDCDQPELYRLECKLPYSTDEWEAIFDVISRDWFKRLWIVQEIHLGISNAVLQCGQGEIPWSLFRSAIICIYSKLEGVPEALMPELGALVRLCDYIGNITFHMVLYDFHNRLCADDRDRIYGLLSLASPEVASSIIPDYRQSLVEVYKQAFLASTQRVQRLEQLPFCGRRYGPAELQGWPTWIPNWSRPVYMSVPPNPGYCASGISASEARYVDPGRLEITALYFGTISGVDKQIAADSISAFFEICRRVGLGQPRYPTGETYQNAWYQTLTIGLHRDRIRRKPSLPTIAELSEAVILAQTNEAAAKGKMERWFRQWIATEINHNYTFRLHNGYIGYLARLPQEGDEVFVIPGCAVPMLLRPTLRGGYEVVSDCYVHGIMDGEAFLGSIPPPWSAIGKRERDGLFRSHYYNRDTNRASAKDPRLEQIPIPPGWEPIKWERTRDDPFHCKRFRNRETGEVISSDPRLFHGALIARGIPLKTITLV